MSDNTTPTSAKRAGEEDEINLIDLLIVFATHKKQLLWLPLLAGGVMAVISMFMTPIYTATAKIMPPQQSQSAASAILGQLGGLAGGAGGALGLKNPSDLYVGMLKSRTIADALIQQFRLKEYYEKDFLEDTRAALDGNTNIAAGKDGLITIEFSDKSPKQAAGIANAYVTELDKLNGGLAITEASQRRVFYENQLKATKDNLAKAQLALKGAIETGGVAMPDAQGMAVVETISQIRAQISAKEVEIGSMKAYAAESNPDLRRAQEQLAAMRRELEQLEGGKGTNATGTGSTGNLTSLQRLQDVKYYQVLFELMAKQYELARIDEAKDPVIIQVVDKAVEPERRSKPKRTLLVLLAMIGTFVLTVVGVFVVEARNRVRADPEGRQRLDALSRALRWRAPL